MSAARHAISLLAAVLLACVFAGCVQTSYQKNSQGAQEIITPFDQSDVDRRARARLELAGAYFGRGQMETALDEVKQALAAKPDLPEAYNLRGLIYANLGQEQIAEESFRRALQLNPRDADAMHNFGWFLCGRGRYAEATAQFTQALAQPQYRAVTRTMLAQGVCLTRAGDFAAAESVLTKSFELDPSNPSTALNLGDVLYRRGEFERARFYLRRVNGQAEVVNAQTLWLAARIENRLGNRRGAEEFGRQLRARFPQSPETLAFEQGRYDE